MSRNRFITPDTTRLDLSDGDWVEVKTRLNWGETQRISSSLLRSIKGSEDEMGIDWAKYGSLRLQTWLVDWSFKDGTDKPVKLTPAAIANLDPETAAEIDAVLSAHVEKLDAEKKATASTTG